MSNFIKLIDSVYDSCCTGSQRKNRTGKVLKPVLSADIVYNSMNYAAKRDLYHLGELIRERGKTFYRTMGYNVFSVWCDIFPNYTEGDTCFNCGFHYPKSAVKEMYDVETDIGSGIEILGDLHNKKVGKVKGLVKKHICLLCSVNSTSSDYKGVAMENSFALSSPIHLYTCSHCGKLVPYWAAISASFFQMHYESKMLNARDLASSGLICFDCLIDSGLELSLQKDNYSEAKVIITNVKNQPEYGISRYSLVKHIKPELAATKADLINYLMDNTDQFPMEKPENPKFDKYHTYKSAITPSIINHYLLQWFIRNNDKLMLDMFKEMGLTLMTFDGHDSNGRMHLERKDSLTAVILQGYHANEIIREITRTGFIFSVVLIIPSLIFSAVKNGDTFYHSVNAKIPDYKPMELSEFNETSLMPYIEKLNGVRISCPYTKSGKWFGTKEFINQDFSKFQQNQFTADLSVKIRNVSVDKDEDALSIIYEMDLEPEFTKVQLSDEQLSEVVQQITKKKVKKTN